VGANTAKIRRVDRPEAEPILVAIDRLRRCPEELGNDFWPPDRTKRKTKVTSTAPARGKSGASTQLDGQVAVSAEKGAMSENQQTSVVGQEVVELGVRRWEMVGEVTKSTAWIG